MIGTAIGPGLSTTYEVLDGSEVLTQTAAEAEAVRLIVNAAAARGEQVDRDAVGRSVALLFAESGYVVTLEAAEMTTDGPLGMWTDTDPLGDSWLPGFLRLCDGAHFQRCRIREGMTLGAKA